jgi:hypothetical protein
MCDSAVELLIAFLEGDLDVCSFESGSGFDLDIDEGTSDASLSRG